VGDLGEPTVGALFRLAEFLELAERAVLLSAVVIAMSDNPGSSAGAKAEIRSAVNLHPVRLAARSEVSACGLAGEHRQPCVPLLGFVA
jgi:hypothetical protein